MTQPNKLGKLPKLLVAFILLNVIGDVGNIIAWLVVPDMRNPLTQTYLQHLQVKSLHFTLAPQFYY